VVFEIPILILSLFSVLLGFAFVWMGVSGLFRPPRDMGTAIAGLCFGSVLIYMGARWIKGIVMKRTSHVNRNPSDGELLSTEQTQEPATNRAKIDS
jgi:predicted permease